MSDSDNNEARDLDKERELFCVPIAQKIIKIIGAVENLEVGESSTHEARIKCYEPIFMDIMQELKDKDVKLEDIPYIFALVLQALEFTKDLVALSINNNRKRAEDKLWNCDSHHLTVQTVDKVLVDASQEK